MTESAEDRRRSDLQRLAPLVAIGAAPFPPDESPDVRASLLREVRRIRRERLVRHIARCIAYRLRAGPAGQKGDPTHAPQPTV